MITDKDISQFKQKGINQETVLKQIEFFKTGFPDIKLIRPAVIDDGILKLDNNKIAQIEADYDKIQQSYKIVKFVPASGAATRMFKDLFEALNKGNDYIAEIIQDSQTPVAKFFNNIEKFAFFHDLEAKAIAFYKKSVKELINENAFTTILKLLLTDEGLNYGNLPKGLIKFHKYDVGARTAFEEHLIEAGNYAASDKYYYLHFTVSPEHREKFEELAIDLKPVYEMKFGKKFIIDFSEQKHSTDTIAVTPDNQPFRNDDGSILFRPGGHGALIENLNDIDADMIFIKNIDNVVPDKLKAPTYKYKKVIAATLVEYKNKIFDLLKRIDNEDISIDEIENFVTTNLFVELPKSYQSFDDNAKKDYLISLLNRPIRVCGMVKNDGEPGGGPFWTENNDGSISLQIVESAQVNKNDANQLAIFENATHFNPVDLVCFVKNYKGEKFDLTKYVDEKRGFISEKSKDGRPLKALELPGLWNGAMSDWNTIFVEVPSETFNPVKTVNDLLREAHQ